MANVHGPSELPGEELSAVSFVRDYVELIFDGPILRCLAPPHIEARGGEARFPGPRSRDLLCQLIGLRVISFEHSDDQLSLSFEGGQRVLVPQRWSSGGPEVAHFVPSRSGRLDVPNMFVWENLATWP